jgi:hypothetical protein
MFMIITYGPFIVSYSDRKSKATIARQDFNLIDLPATYEKAPMSRRRCQIFVFGVSDYERWVMADKPDCLGGV